MSYYAVAKTEPVAKVKYPEVDRTYPVVSIDFDGVLAENTWPSPELGKSIQAGIDLLLHYYEEGAQINILTARPASHWPQIWHWFKLRELGHVVYDVSNIKQPACMYIDDRAWRFPFE